MKKLTYKCDFCGGPLVASDNHEVMVGEVCVADLHFGCLKILKRIMEAAEIPCVLQDKKYIVKHLEWIGLGLATEGKGLWNGYKADDRVVFDLGGMPVEHLVIKNSGEIRLYEPDGCMLVIPAEPTP